VEASAAAGAAVAEAEAAAGEVGIRVLLQFEGVVEVGSPLPSADPARPSLQVVQGEADKAGHSCNE
jgi:hypothetical protein